MRGAFTLRPSSAPLLTADQPLLRLSRGTINRPIPATTPPPCLRLTTLAVGSAFQPDEATVPAPLPLPVPPVSKFKIALCQLSVTPEKERNIARARKAIEEAAGRGAQLVILPEIWNSPLSNDNFPVYAEDIEGVGDAAPSFSMLSEAARSLQITIIGGSIPERSGDRLYNTCCVFGTDGKLLGKHRKIHLFDIDIPGEITFKESNTLTAGKHATIVDTDVGRIGIGICHDIRFPELAILYAARGAHLLCYPGAFNITTGSLLWELMQRARSLTLWHIYFYYTFQREGDGAPSHFTEFDSLQLFVATCSPARDTGACYIAWGHSTLVGPFGEVIAMAGHEEAIIVEEVDYSLIELRRSSIPLNQQRRGDLYRLVDVHRLNSRGL